MQPTGEEGLRMPRKTKVSSEVLELAKETAQKAKTADDLRGALAVLMPGLLNIPDHITAQIIGRKRGTIVRLRKKFASLTQHPVRNWGGRRYGYLSVEQERQFLSRFLEKASQGGVLVVSEIVRAFEALVGHKVAQSTIYPMLDRHDWRTIIPRPRHPESDIEARKGFKKTPENGG